MVSCQSNLMASYNTNFLNKLDNDYECNRSKMWYMSLRKALIILKADLTTKSTKLNDLDECIGKLKNPAYGLLIELANEKMRDVTKNLEDFFVFFEDYNKLERMLETLVFVTGNEKPDKQQSSPPPPPPQQQQQIQHHNHHHQQQHHHNQPQPIQQHYQQPQKSTLSNQPQQIQQLPQMQTLPQQQQQQSLQPSPEFETAPEPDPPEQIQSQQLPQVQHQLLPPQHPTSSFNSLSLTPRSSHNQSPLSTPIRSFLIQTTDLFHEIKTPDKSLIPSSPFSAELKNFTTPIRVLDDDSPSTASLSTPKPTDHLSDPLSTPIATHHHYYSNSYVVKDLMKDLKTPEKKQVPPSPLSVVIASSGIENNTITSPPVLEFNLSPARSVTPIFVSSTKKTSTTTTTETISTDSSPSMPVVSLPRGVLRSKRVSLEKFQHYNSIGLKRRADSAPILARQRQQRKLAPKSIIEITASSSSSQNPLTTQFLKNIKVDQFLSKVHDKK